MIHHSSYKSSIMYKAIVNTLFDLDSDQIEIDVDRDEVSIYAASEDSHILRIDLQVVNSVRVVSAGTKILQWNIIQGFNDDFMNVHLYPDDNSIEEDEPIICKVSSDDLLAGSKACQDRLKEVERKYKELEEKYNDLYNRPPELGGPGYIEAMEDFRIKAEGESL